MEKTEIKFDAPFEKNISRLFIFRRLYVFVEGWVVLGWAIWMGIVLFIQFWIMLILGERNETIWKKQLRFMRHMMKWNAYLSYLTDKRPEWVED